MVEIKINVGRDDIRVLRSTSIGRWELCVIKNNKGEEVIVPEVFYSGLANMIEYIIGLRVARSDATTLAKLAEVIKKEHKKVREMFAGMTDEIEEVELNDEEEEEEKPKRRSRRRRSARKAADPTPDPDEEEEDEETEEKPRRRSRRRRRR